jgi:hypothetical protein
MFGLPLWITAWLLFYWACVIGSWFLSFSGVLFGGDKKKKGADEK